MSDNNRKKKGLSPVQVIAFAVVMPKLRRFFSHVERLGRGFREVEGGVVTVVAGGVSTVVVKGLRRRHWSRRKREGGRVQLCQGQV